MCFNLRKKSKPSSSSLTVADGSLNKLIVIDQNKLSSSCERSATLFKEKFLSSSGIQTRNTSTTRANVLPLHHRHGQRDRYIFSVHVDDVNVPAVTSPRADDELTPLHVPRPVREVELTRRA